MALIAKDLAHIDGWGFVPVATLAFMLLIGALLALTLRTPKTVSTA
jgi:hypothetical protein